MNARLLIGVAAIALTLVLAAACGTQDTGSAGNTVKIGVTSPLSGPAAQSGIALRQGMEIAAKEWNEQGGIEIEGEKKKIEALFADCESKPEVGVSAATRLITREQVDFLISDAFHSSVTLATMELAPQYNIPMLSGEPVSSEISEKIASNPEKYKLFWKGDFDSSAYAEAVHDTYSHLIEEDLFTPKNKKIAFIVEDTDYGRSNAQLTAKLFKEDGWEVVANETVPLGHSDFFPQLSELRSRAPSILVSVFTSVNSGAALSKQFQEQGLNASHFGIYYPTRPEFYKQAGDSANSLIWAPLLFEPNSVEEHKRLDDKVRKAYGASATSDHAYGYDTFNNAVEAIRAAGSVDPQAVSNAFAEMERQGVLGRYVFDENHTVKAGPEFIPVPTAQIREGGKNVTFYPKTRATGDYEPQPWLKGQ